MSMFTIFLITINYHYCLKKNNDRWLNVQNICSLINKNLKKHL